MEKKRVFIPVNAGLLTPSQKGILDTINHIDAPDIFDALKVALGWSFAYPDDLGDEDKFAQGILMLLLLDANKMARESPSQIIPEN